MSTHRSVLREAVAQAIDVSEWGYDIERVRTFIQLIGEEDLPVFGATVLGETAEEYDKDQYSRTVQLQVAWKRLGGSELEDTIDDDAAAIEAIALPILMDLAFNVVPIETQFDLGSADGGQRHCTGILIFACTVLTNIPAG